MSPKPLLFGPQRAAAEGTVPLKVTHQGNDSVIADGDTALVGSDASSDVRIVRPGISRRHAVVSYDGSDWKVEDAGSRNGTFEDGKRVRTKTIDGPTTLYLGHPTNGESITLTPVTTAKAKPTTSEPEIEPFNPPPIAPPVERDPAKQPTSKAAPSKSASSKPPPSKTMVQPAASGTSASDVELAQLTAAMRDQISAVKGLTWSVWAMIAVTAALIVMTLFVGILSN
ncbi:MAG: FHA domain-containing protein [Acidimicrobiia bacterium]